MIKLLVCEEACMGIDRDVDYAVIASAFSAHYVSNDKPLDIRVATINSGYSITVYDDGKTWIEHVGIGALLFKLCIAVENVAVSFSLFPARAKACCTTWRAPLSTRIGIRPSPWRCGSLPNWRKSGNGECCGQSSAALAWSANLFLWRNREMTYTS